MVSIGAGRHTYRWLTTMVSQNIWDKGFNVPPINVDNSLQHLNPFPTSIGAVVGVSNVVFSQNGSLSVEGAMVTGATAIFLPFSMGPIPKYRWCSCFHWECKAKHNASRHFLRISIHSIHVVGVTTPTLPLLQGEFPISIHANLFLSLNWLLLMVCCCWDRSGRSHWPFSSIRHHMW